MSDAPWTARPEAVKPPSPHQPQSRLAVWSLVLSLIGVVVPSAICGVIALRRIKRHGQAGRGMAIAGIAISVAMTVVIGGAIVYAVSTDAERDASGAIAEGGRIDVFDLRVGDCLEDVEDDEAIYSVTAVPCDRPHAAEVFAIYDLPDGAWPGIDTVTADAEDGCNERLDEASDEALQDPDVGVYFFHPTKDSWNTRNDRAVTCVATFESPISGSGELATYILKTP